MQEQPFPAEVSQNPDHRPATFEVEREEGEAADAVVLRLLGEHDIASAEELRSRLFALIRSGKAVVVDLTETDFIDSTVLHGVLQADQALQETGRRLVLQYGTTAIVRRVLEVSGVLDQLPHAASREDAAALADTQARPNPS